MLSSEPSLGVEAGRFLTELEMECRIARGIGGNGANRLACLDVLATAHGRRGEVAIDRHVTAVTHDDVVHAAVGEDGRHFATEYGTRLCSYRSRDVDAFTIELYPIESCDVVCSIVTRDAISSCDRHGKSATVSRE